MGVHTREVEWQFDAHDLDAVERELADIAARGAIDDVTVERIDDVEQTDDYLDTADATLLRAGLSLRLRQRNDGTPAEATLKSVGGRSTDDQPRVRLEISEPVDADDPLAALRRSRGPVGGRVRSLIGRKRLATRVTVHTRRSTHALARAGAPAGEVAIDATTITAPRLDEPAHLRRIEVEVPHGTIEAMTPFVNRLRSTCGLVPATRSKFETGIAHAGFAARPARPLGPTTVTRQSTIGELALAVLRRQFLTLTAKEAGTRLGDDIEDLHEMRVACRRMRAALSLFGDSLPDEVNAAGEDLRWLGRELGAVRDLDVQIEQVDAWIADLGDHEAPGLAVVRDLLEEQRRVARQSLLGALDSARYRDLLRRLRTALGSTGVDASEQAARPARAVAPQIIDRRYRRFARDARRIGPASPDADLHRLRIDAKRLRYALEFVRDALPKGTKRPLSRLVELQDLLGLHQDAATAIERLHAMAETHGADLPIATVFALGELSERYRSQMATLREQFPQTWQRVRACDWKRLRT